ncbi:MAG: hypothetical protein KKD31_19055 [Bacteroidetes bacterium]|nr:hypothetical protein [Bacteroidota bacterium]
MRTILFILLAFSLSACGSNSSNQKSSHSTNSNEYSDDYAEDEEREDDYQDGTYSATVYYNNSETGYSATYSLEVEVEDNQVVVIYFPNDGYLDSDHIIPADLDENGSAFVYGEDGKTYQVQID